MLMKFKVVIFYGKLMSIAKGAMLVLICRLLQILPWILPTACSNGKCWGRKVTQKEAQ